MTLKKLKLLLVGDYSNPVYTGTLGSFKRAFEKLNINTVDFFFNVNLNYIRLGIYFKKAFQLIVQKEQIRLLNFIKQKNITHVLVIKGSYILPQTIEEIKKKGITIVNFNPDNPFNTVKASSNFNIREGIQHYNYYFSWSKEICKQINQFTNSTIAIYLPFAVDKDLIQFMPDFNNQNYTYQISFGANADKERIAQIKTLINQDESIAKDLFIFGSGWSKFKEINSKEIKGAAYFKTIAKSKINLNFLRNQNKGAHNLRTFEIPACGGFMLHEYSEEAMEIFKPDIHAVYFKTMEDCIDKIKYYREKDYERIEIAKAGYYEAIKFENSYEARTKQILQCID